MGISRLNQASNSDGTKWPSSAKNRVNGVLTSTLPDLAGSGLVPPGPDTVHVAVSRYTGLNLRLGACEKISMFVLVFSLPELVRFAVELLASGLDPAKTMPRSPNHIHAVRKVLRVK